MTNRCNSNKNTSESKTKSIDVALAKAIETASSPVRPTFKNRLFQKMFECVPAYKVKAVQQIAGEGHPELQGLSPDEVEMIPLDNTFVKGNHNDICFFARNKVYFMIEAESIQSTNILARILAYIAKIASELLKDVTNDILNTSPSRKVFICCMLTEEQQNTPDQITIQSHIVESNESLKVITFTLIHTAGDGIFGEFIGASRILDSMIQKENAVVAIDKCIQEGFLADFLEHNKDSILEILNEANL